MRHRPGKTNRRGRRGVDVPIGSQPIGSAPGMRMTSSSVVCRAEGTEGTSTTSPSPEPVKPELERLAKLLRVNAYVELVGGAAVFANPSAVFPGLNAAGIEASQWYALTLGCVALASFLASKLDVHDERTARSVAAPVVAGMTAYHLGISAFQVRRVATMGAVPVAVGALFVHGGLTIAFAVAAAYVLRPRSSS